MNFSIGKIIFFLTLLCTVAFAGGIEEDSGPEEINNEMTDKTQWNNENFPELINDYAELAHSSDCAVKYSGGYVNDPDLVAWSCN